MDISIIVAVAENGVIGKDNKLLWNLPDDMKFFTQKTKGHVVIMGRKTYESIPEKFRPLPNRTNVVITSNSEYPASIIAQDLETVFRYYNLINKDEVFIIGGAMLYNEAMEYANTLYVTEIKASFEGDTYFPEIDKTKWKEVERINHPIDEKHKYEFDFVKYIKK